MTKNIFLPVFFLSLSTLVSCAMGVADEQQTGNAVSSSGTKDHKPAVSLTGSWQASSAEIYVFHTDGRFNHFSTSSKTEGRYRASDSKIYFTNIIYEKGETWENQYPDAVYEYEMGKDNEGDFLKIANFLYGVTIVDNRTAYTFRKSKPKNDIDETPATAKTGNPFQLKIYHGFDFSTRQVVRYNETTPADLKFFQQTRNVGVYAYLRADKIKEFESPPDSISAAEINDWKDYIMGPKLNRYYVIRAKDGRHYLLHLIKYENQGKAASYWLLNFDWKEITVNNPRDSGVSSAKNTQCQLSGSWGYFGDKSLPEVYIFNKDGLFVHYSFPSGPHSLS